MSHSGHLSLVIPPWIGALSTRLGWKGNRRSGVALAMRHRHSGLPTYGLNGLYKGDEHPVSVYSMGLLYLTFLQMRTDFR